MKRTIEILAALLSLGSVTQLYSETNGIFAAGYRQFREGLNSLENVLDEWAEFPKPTEEARAGWTNEAYAVFEDLWTPTNLVRLGEFEAGQLQYWYQEAPYLIVQGDIRVCIATDAKTFESLSSDRVNLTDGAISNNVTTFTIKDFRPKTRPTSCKTIILTEGRKQALLGFLGEESDPVGTGNIMNPAQARGESERRASYISHLLRIRPGHWGGWHLATYPEASLILFSHDAKKAKAFFRIRYQGGTATYEKNEKGKWSLKESHDTWIE